MAHVFMAAYTNYRRDPRVKREAEALVELGHHVVFLARRQLGESNRENIAGVDVIKTLGFKKKCNSFVEYLIDYAIFFLMIFLHLLANPFRYQLIHINNMPDFLVFATCLPRLFGIPVIHDIHDLMPEIYAEKFASGEQHWVVKALKLQERWAGKYASVVLTVEDRLKDILSGRGIPAKKIHVLMNLPDDRIFKRREIVIPKPENTKFVMVYHGTLARRLGLDIAIKAVNKAKRQIPNLEFRIIGDGEERGALIALCDQLALQNIVTFSEGFIPVEQIPPLIDDSDVGLIPLRISDGTDIMLPTKLLEYVTIGIPCITPKTGTIKRYFDENMVQFFEAENVDSLAEAIVTLYNDQGRRTLLTQNSNERFANTYNWSEHKKLYTSLVEQLIGK